LESYKVKQNFYGLLQAYLTPILLLFIIVSFLMAYNKEGSNLALIYLLVIVPLVSYRYFQYIKRPMEIEVTGDQLKMKDIFGKITECAFTDITDIEVNKRREIYFTIGENKIRSLNTYKDFDKFLEDAKKKNTNLKLWGFDKK